MLKEYGNWHGDSGISQYDDSAPDSIIVEYGGKADKRYIFTVAKCGREHIEEMKRCARGGLGLAEYINTNKLRGDRVS